MRPWRKIALKRKLMLIIMLTSSVALLLACAAFMAYDVFAFRQKMRQDLNTTAQMLGDQLYYRQYFTIVAGVMTLSFGVALLLSSKLQTVISDPILELAEMMRRVSREKNYALRARKTSADEIGEMIEGFNEMLGQIQIRDQELDRARAQLELRVNERTGELQAEIAERKELTAKLERSNQELQAFAYVASHDLQEPLRKVQAFGDRLRAKCQEALSEEGKDYLQRMQNAARRMQNLIDDLLLFSRVTTQPQPFEQVDLSNLIMEVLTDLEVRILQTGGILQVGNLPAIEADPTQMRQLFQNLISNALKFHRPSTPPVVQVHCRILDSPEHWPGPVTVPGPFCEMSVRDYGVGFEEKYLDRIFAVFQRLHGRQDFEGTGVGLAICRKIVERHNGVITAKGMPGEGAVFLVTLPMKQLRVRP
jgi:two-component system, NtrC family, sensor kinase